ncbi:response regulator [Bdellovibrionota bacterium FG-1]
MTDNNGIQKVLLIEDDEMARGALNKILVKEGFQMLTAVDGQAGLDLFDQERPGIVITDLRMPKIDGMEVLRRIRLKSRDTQVIVITGHGDYDLAIKALSAGATDYLKKPIDIGELLTAVGRCKEVLVGANPALKQPVVLVIEDDATARGYLEKAMVKEGWTVLVAADGQEGLDLFHREKVDIVLTDVKMPKKGGLDVLRDIKANSNNDCEVILMTGYGDETSAIEAMRNGAINYIRKPLDLDVALIAVTKAFEKLQLSRGYRFKVRELELAKQVIARVTPEGLSFSIGNQVAGESLSYLSQLLDVLPIGLMVVDKNLKVFYSNKFVRDALGAHLEAFDSKLIEQIIGTKSQVENATGVVEQVRELFGKKGEIKSIPLSPRTSLVASMARVSMGGADTPELMTVTFMGLTHPSGGGGSDE